MAAVWIVIGSVLGVFLVALLAFLAVAQVRVWRADRQVYTRPPELSPAQVRWANDKRLGDDPEATLIIPVGDPNYIRPVDWRALQARDTPWLFHPATRPDDYHGDNDPPFTM
ncbi:hypothetical protein [Prauserella flavalba]|uniref:hypothetical protein n=1 Tax=Prauserella flavalba TaxID=1477506 RepID=UPI0011B5B1D1|nr:hypothetical protein [Prauserella flavalba]